MRPIGSLLMGRYADRHGRRAALTLSITVMAGGSLIIACTPSYESIGIMAPIILVLARLLQGLSLAESTELPQRIYLKWLVVVAAAFIQVSNM